MKSDSFSESAEMYLKTVSELAPRQDPVPISAVADRLGVSTVSATEMVHRLQEQQLLAHTPYKGVSLTDRGRERATAVVRSHRLWEYFLSAHLGLPWDVVHEVACRLEHVTPAAVSGALDDYLGHPARCPHGNPIPEADGTARAEDGVPLVTLAPGQLGRLVRVYPETPELLNYLMNLGIAPGAHVVLREVAPFGGPLVLILDDGTACYLAREAAANVYVSVERSI